MRAAHLLLLLALASASAAAQNPSPTPASGLDNAGAVLADPEPQGGRGHQRTERIHVEDGGSRVDELRVGGQTQVISVQPKAGDMPGYEVKSPDGARSRVGSHNGAETNTAPRVWNVLRF